MNRNKMLWLLSMVIALGLCMPYLAQAERWVYLGNSHVNGERDHDNIKVGRSDGRFRAIQLRVSGGAIEFQRVVVHYGNGSQEDVAIRDTIPAGGRTRAIDLPGERRTIESVELWYSKGRWSHDPKVTLYGMK